ncbi:hypothetical protein [Nostoc sp.]|uniref:hypothetical protein n=1 Tax=Nostoc sp. TaxID=1180 RepID=UPI002FFCC250
MPVVDGGTLQTRSDRLIFSTTTSSFTVEAFLSKTTLPEILVFCRILPIVWSCRLMISVFNWIFLDPQNLKTWRL